MDPTIIFNLIMGILSSLPRDGDLLNESLVEPHDVATPNFTSTPPSESGVLHDKVERMALVNAAMWSLISEKLGITPEELIAKIREVDLIDGRPDGKISSTAKTCPKCSRIMNSTTGNCLYCNYTPPPADISIQVAAGNMRVGGKDVGK